LFLGGVIFLFVMGMKRVEKEKWSTLDVKDYVWVRYKGDFYIMQRDGDWFIGNIQIQTSEVQEVFEVATPKEIHAEISKAWREAYEHAAQEIIQ